MANWCYNTLSLSGKYKNFAKQLEKHNYKIMGFEFIKNGRCIFELDKIEDGMYSFTSKWAPPLEELAERASKGKFSFELDYEECGCQIYGKAIFDIKSGLITYDLPQEVWNKMDFNDDGDLHVDGIYIESEMEWLEEQLELVIKNTIK